MTTEPEIGRPGPEPMPGDSNGRNVRLGLSYWMERVLKQADAASRELSAERVHDLRVTLRRCRSMAEGFMALDPDKAWNCLLKDGRQLFRQLGKLRDVQVLLEWTGRLAQPEEEASVAMLFHLGRKEQELKRAAAASLQRFNHQKWRGRIRRLEARARRLPVGGTVFQLAALHAWTQAHRCHKRALRDRTPAAWHRLRIAVKRFRYTVENFLPLRHSEWGGDLKDMQDCLGELHDLSVFWQTAAELRIFPDPETSDRWRGLLASEETKRIERYREKMVGKHSLWRVWRKGLPAENRLPSMSLQIVGKWAALHGLDLARARRVRSLSLQLFNGLPSNNGATTKDRRAVLHVAAVLHELGGEKRAKRGGSAARLLLMLPCLPGFAAESLLCAAMVILGHRGKFWTLEDGEYAAVSETQRKVIMELSGILRLARVLAFEGERIGPFRVEQNQDSIIIEAKGYIHWGPLAEKVARARYVLECARQRAVIVRSVPDSGHLQDRRDTQEHEHAPQSASGSIRPGHEASTTR